MMTQSVNLLRQAKHDRNHQAAVPLDATGMRRDKVARADALISTGQSIAAAAAHIHVNKRCCCYLVSLMTVTRVRLLRRLGLMEQHQAAGLNHEDIAKLLQPYHINAMSQRIRKANKRFFTSAFRCSTVSMPITAAPNIQHASHMDIVACHATTTTRKIRCS